MKHALTSHTPGEWNRENCQAPDGLGIAVSIGAKQPGEEFPREIALVIPHEDQEANARLILAAPEMLQALQYALELIPIARGRFPKSIKHHDRFQLENVCATIGNAIHKATKG